MAAETEPFESTDVTPLGSGFLGWVKSEVYRRKVGACSHFGCCCPHKESEDQIRQKKKHSTGILALTHSMQHSPS